MGESAGERGRLKRMGDRMIKRVLKYGCILIAAAGCIGLLFTVFCNQSLKTGKKTYDPKKMKEIPEADFAIVPGCLVYANGKPSYALEDRLNTGFALYQNKKVKKLILSGAKRENRTGQKYLVEKGVPKEDIMIDDGGLDTYSTIYRCIEAFAGKKFLVCTQEKYFKRTGFLISELGMNGNCVKVDAHTYKKEIYERFRDFFAADKAWIECKITKPEPYYDLDQLPIL